MSARRRTRCYFVSDADFASSSFPFQPFRNTRARFFHLQGDSMLIRASGTQRCLAIFFVIAAATVVPDSVNAKLGSTKADLQALKTLPGPSEVIVSTENCTENVEVSWTPPAKDLFVGSYVVRCTSLDDRVVVVVDASLTSATVGPLDFDTEYVCSVSSKGKVGSSEPIDSDPFVIL